MPATDAPPAPFAPDAIDALGLTSDQFVAAAARRDVSRDRALALYRRVHRDGESGDLPSWIGVRSHEEVRREVDGETIKFALALAAPPPSSPAAPDAAGAATPPLETESVLIPMRGRSGERTRTLCVSSQVGCAMGCVFCETAQMGLLRHLAAGDIIAQWRHATHVVREPVKNIVFMGMGEPMDNFDAVEQAIRVLVDHNGPAVPASNITVSTVGRLDGIERMADLVRETGFHRLNLAVSVNAPNDEVRSEIMPVNRSAPMAALRDALLRFPLRARAAICVEYVLIPGVNDGDADCDQICAWLEPLRCSLNVIPYNPRRDSPWPAPTEDAVERFLARAIANGQFTKRRGTKGRDAMAACGQLGNPEVRRRKFVPLGRE